MDNTAKKLLATSALIGTILLSLLGGLAFVVRSLRNVNLTLFLELKNDDTREKNNKLPKGY